MANTLQTFYDLVEEIEIAMMTTRRRDGHLRSRAMANQRRAPGADLWFVTMEGAAKLDDIANDPHVNLAYYKDSSREWISVSGTATLSRDRETIRQLYATDWQMWFSKEGDPRHGTADDPRIVLIGIRVHAAEFLELQPHSRVSGDVHYSALEMHLGAIVEGRLVHAPSASETKTVELKLAKST